MPGFYGSSVYGQAAYGPGTGGVATLDQLKRHLNKTLNASDEQLQDLLDVAVGIAEGYCGRVWAARLVTQTADGGHAAVVLHYPGVQSVEAITEDGVTLAASEWTADLVAGVVYRGAAAGGGVQRWACGRQNITVAYVAGPGAVPATVRHAVLELARHLWDTQRGGSGVPVQRGAGDDWDPRSGFSVPRRVAELLDPYTVGGMA